MTRRARATDPFTSWAATRKTNPDYDNRLRSMITSALVHFGPMTHDQLIELLRRVKPVSDSGVRTRVRELVDSGHVEQVPDMIAKSRYGRASLLWRIKE